MSEIPELPDDVMKAAAAVSGQIEEYLLTYDGEGCATLIQPNASSIIARAIMAERERGSEIYEALKAIVDFNDECASEEGIGFDPGGPKMTRAKAALTTRGGR